MKNVTFHIVVFLVNILIPLIIGAVLYRMFNPDTYIGVLLGKYCGIYHGTRLHGIMVNQQAGMLIRNYAADMVWAYAFAFSICFICDQDKRTQFIALIMCAVLEMLIEAGQYFHIISGYFDYMDIAVEVMMNFMAYSVWKYVLKLKYGGRKQ